MKTCSKCKIEKPKTEFQKQSCKADGLRYHCKECRATSSEAKRSAYTEERKQEIASNQKKRYDNRTEYQKILERKQNNARSATRYSNDINFKLSTILRARLNGALNNNQKVGSAVSDLGCSIEELRVYLESKFEPWMNWENHGPHDKNRRTWQIDHIDALANIDLTNKEEFKKACNFNNLQPLCTKENLKKKNK